MIPQFCVSSLPLRFMISAEPQEEEEEEEEEGRKAERRNSASPGFMDWRYRSEFFLIAGVY